MDGLKLHHLVLIEANYQYEMLTHEDNIRHPQCFLLFGLQSDRGTTLLSRSIVIPLSLNFEDDTEGNFQYDSMQVSKRIELVTDTNPHLKPCGIMVVNDRFYDYTNIVEQLTQEQIDIRYLFSYEPHIDSETEFELYAFLIQREGDGIELKRVGYELENTQIAIKSQVDDEDAIDLLSGKRRDEEETQFAQRLIEELDRFIQYLEVPENNNSEILRHISMLVAQLRRDATKDIEEELMNKECEINVLKIACEQWEMTTSQMK